MVKIIALFSSVVVNLETEATTYGEVKQILESEQGFNRSLDGMRCVEGNTKTTLEHPEAVLPTCSSTGEQLDTLRLFFRPIKTDHGRFQDKSHKELKEIIQKEGNKLKKFLENWSGGVNWTRMTSEALRSAIEIYFDVEEPNFEEEEEVQEEISDSKEETNAYSKAFEIIMETLISYLSHFENDEEVTEKLGAIIEDIQEAMEMEVVGYSKEDTILTNMMKEQEEIFGNMKKVQIVDGDGKKKDIEYYQ